MTTQTAPRLVAARQIRTNRVTNGWHCWNDYRGGVLVNAMKTEEGWEVKRRTREVADEPVLVATVKDLAEVRAVIANLYNEGQQTIEEALATVRRERKPAPTGVNPTEVGVKVGAIFYAAWGYDQTNVDFYEVVALTPKGVKVRRIGKIYTDQVGPHDMVAAAPGTFQGETMTKRLRKFGDKPNFNLTTYANAYLWDGKPQYQTGWGFGH
jgi:hypothetical protein